MARKSLTAKQKTFVSEYLVDKNATQAALRAGYSEKTAYSIGNENLKKPEIANEIEKQLEKGRKRNETTIDYIDEMHREAYQVAKENGQASAMTTAAKNLGDLHGLAINPSTLQLKDPPAEINLIAKD